VSSQLHAPAALPGERVSGTHWIGGWVGHVAGLDTVETRKFLTPSGLELWHLGRPTCIQSLYPLRYSGSPYIYKYYTHFIFFGYWEVESILGPLSTAATPGLLYLPRVIVRMEKLVEWTVLAGGTEVLGENLPRRLFVYHKSHLPDPGVNPDRRGVKPATKVFSYVSAFHTS
jgi:hypothetical protein